MTRLFGLLAIAAFMACPAAAQETVSESVPASIQSVPPSSAVRPFRFFRQNHQAGVRYASRADRIRHAKIELSTQRFPKFYGGFHSSHFSNLGVPSGDLGFRGNGVYWAPW